MMKHSFLLYAAAGLMIAGAASATTLTVYNEDEYGTCLLYTSDAADD